MSVREHPHLAQRTHPKTVLWLLAWYAAAAPLAAQGGAGERQPHIVPPATSKVTIDGVIGESAWDDALTLELAYEVRPGENTPPPVRTVVFLTYDEGHVLVAFRAFDIEPNRIRARYRDRDQVYGDDWVGITLDTFNDQRRAYEFMINPLGVQSDGITNDVDGDYDSSWDAIWDSAGRLTDFGYEVEVAIPFNQIRFQSTTGPQVWGLDLTRSWPRTNRVHIGLFARERGVNSYLGQAEKIIGFEGASPGRNLELAPTLTGFAVRERPVFPVRDEVVEARDLELGSTVTWGITPNITLTGALNPDFSDIEADAVKLALNERFELIFDEKRPFFLESADYFDSGQDLVYTRLIADPLAAIKLTGKMGRHTVALMTAHDEITNLIVPGAEESDSGAFDTANTAFVGRYRYDLGSGSTIGALVTNRMGTGGYGNRLLSADARLRPTVNDTISVNAGWSSTTYSQEMQSDLELGYEEISGHGLDLEYVHSTRDWFAFAEYSDLADGFRADLGFLPQVGYREGNLGAGYVWWGDDLRLYNRIEAGVQSGRTVNQDGDLLRQGSEAWLEVEGPLETEAQVELGRRTVVHRGVRFDDLLIPELEFSIRPSAFLRISVEAQLGDWVDFDNVRPADRTRFATGIDLDLGRHLRVELDYLYSELGVEGGRLFTAHVPQMKTVWQFNARTFVRGILQYSNIERNPELYDEVVDEEERDAFVQLLFSYKVNPRTVLFVGYSEGGAETDDFSYTSTSRAVFLKLGYAWLW